MRQIPCGFAASLYLFRAPAALLGAALLGAVLLGAALLGAVLFGAALLFACEITPYIEGRRVIDYKSYNYKSSGIKIEYPKICFSLKTSALRATEFICPALSIRWD